MKIYFKVKTSRYWINKIKDPVIRKKVFKYSEETALNHCTTSVREAIASLFVWDDTEEGYLYWAKLNPELNED